MTTFNRRTAVVTIYQGDYLDRIRHVERQYEAAVATEARTTRLASDIPESEQLFRQHEELVAEAEETKVDVTVQALGRKQWRDLVAAHPPRKDHEGDAAVGVDESTFKDALVPASIVSPDLTEDDLDELSDIDFDRIYLNAFGLNRVGGSGPKALVRASQTNQQSAAN